MGSNDANPTLIAIQEGDTGRAPLFLIHAASGGILDYFKLHDLGRIVYAISNPWFDSEAKWEGGIQTLVDEYTRLIRARLAHTRGRRTRVILLVGWSVGGQLALEIARVVNSSMNAHDNMERRRRFQLNVTGLVMIDTLYPYWGPPGTIHAEMPVNVLVGPSSVDTKTREKMLRMMAWMNEDSLAWGERNSKATSAREQVEDWQSEPPPPAVLLYATRYIPVGSKSDEKTPSPEQSGPRVMTDYLRRDRTLGWESMFVHGAEFIVANWEVDGHHFELFNKNLIKDTSEKVRRACDLLAED